MPLATISPHGQTIRIVHVNEAARQAYVRSGQTLAEAKAVVPELVTFPDDPSADRRQLEDLALWTQNLSPVVHIEGEDTLLADVTGCEHLFRGEENLLQQARAGLAGQGFTIRGAIADTPGAAWALAHAHGRSAVIAEPGLTAPYLAPLPVWALRVDARTTDALLSVGVETIESLLHLPRSSLTSRFGDSLLDRLDQALGDLPELLAPYRPAAAVTSRLEFGGATDRWEVLLEAVRQATTRLCEQLNRQTAGVRQLFVTFDSPKVPTEGGTQTRRTTLSVSLSQATRSAGRLFSLLKVKMEGLRLIAPADAVGVWARQIEHLDDEQMELFDAAGCDVKALGDLLDRLVVRLGHEAVVRPEIISDHQPERAFGYEPVINVEKSKSRKVERKRARERGYEGSRGRRELSIVDCRLPIEDSRVSNALVDRPDPNGRLQRADYTTVAQAESPRYTTAASALFNRQSTIDNRQFASTRPTRLLLRPVSIAAVSIVPDGPPMAFTLHGRRHEVVNCIGPERIETGWWRGQHVRRDYFRVCTDTGRHCWLFRTRDAGQWFLHGWFD